MYYAWQPTVWETLVEPNKIALLNFLLQHKSATQQKIDRNSIAGNKKTIEFLGTVEIQKIDAGSQKIKNMKLLVAAIVIAFCLASTSCNVGRGCPTNGKNVGAERVLGGDAKTMKALKRVKKFRAWETSKTAPFFSLANFTAQSLIGLVFHRI